MKTELTFKLVAETKGAVRYGEVVNGNIVNQPNAPGAVIGVLYVRKSGLGGKIPEVLKITVES